MTSLNINLFSADVSQGPPAKKFFKWTMEKLTAVVEYTLAKDPNTWFASIFENHILFLTLNNQVNQSA